MMYNKKIECLSEKQMFEYIYPMKSYQTYVVAVASCLIEGIGTEENIKEGIAVLYSSNSLNARRKLIKIYNDGKVVEKNENKIYNILKEILESSEPTDYFINLLSSLSPESTTQFEETPYYCYQNSKIESLISIAEKSDDYNKIRYYDFARKCGSQYAAKKEAEILFKTFNLKKLAFSILKTSGADPQDELFIKIGSDHYVLVNIDEELNKFFLDHNYKSLDFS